jgi:hypothetical protein
VLKRVSSPASASDGARSGELTWRRPFACSRA